MLLFLIVLSVGPIVPPAVAQSLEERAADQARFLLEQAAVFRLEQGRPVASLGALAFAGYVDAALLTDPWGRPFEYSAATGREGEIAVWSRGPGGTGGFTPGSPGRFTGEAMGYSTGTGLYMQGR